MDKFAPVPGWENYQWKEKQKVPTVAYKPNLDVPLIVSTKKVAKGIVYYTDNRLEPFINEPVQKYLVKARSNGISNIISMALKEKTTFADSNFSMPDFERCYLTMFKQILLGLEICDTDIVFLCEHDVIYHPSHFDFIPPRKDLYYYNENVYQINTETGKTVYWRAKRVSQLCAYRDLLLKHYQRRVQIVEEKGFTMRMGFEPGTHNRDERIDDYKAEGWFGEFPNLDLKHGKNLTRSKWSPKDFRNKKNCVDWKDVDDEIPGWGKPQINIKEFLNGV